MSHRAGHVRHDVAWLTIVRWASAAVLWTVVGAVWLFPHLDLSLRAVAPLGLAAAICRTLVVARWRTRPAARFLQGLSLCVDAALLTGLLDAASYLTKPTDADQIVAAFDGTQPAAGADVPSLARVEWEHIQRVLTDCNGNVSQAARALGVHRRSLQRKLAKNPASR